ncbi:Suppressor of fri [Thalictrum thalictroides]|uniref:Suppressor of fri n=1 Tax=Thalictrum thalictroides TaxID=46969 RepID=A0A7J6W828_THATH|nr:Suppressor of fri [Thalictrum thalictroides]
MGNKETAMGRKNKAESESLVWCYYCDEKFAKDKLLSHQKEAHFKCHVCAKKFLSVGGMALHHLQNHKDVKANELPVSEGVENKHIRNTKRARHDEPDGELIKTEICETRIIPPKRLAAHSGDQGEDAPSNLTKVEIPSANLIGVVVAGAGGVGFPPESIVGAVQPINDSELAAPPSGCPQLQVPPHPASPTVAPVGLHQQPSSPTQNVIIPLSSTTCPALPPSFPINGPRVPSAHVSVACPKTGCPPPPVLRKKVRPASDNVHFVWDDEAISMEERRMALLKYQLSGVH